MVNLIMLHFFFVEFDHKIPNKNPKLVNELFSSEEFDFKDLDDNRFLSLVRVEPNL